METVEFPVVNRTAVTIIPKKPFWDWVNSVEPGGEVVSPEKMEARSIYLIPEFEDLTEGEKYLRSSYDNIFISELDGWYRNESVWPNPRTWEMFKAWFDYQLYDIIYDTEPEELEKE